MYKPALALLLLPALSGYAQTGSAIVVMSELDCADIDAAVRSCTQDSIARGASTLDAAVACSASSISRHCAGTSSTSGPAASTGARRSAEDSREQVVVDSSAPSSSSISDSSRRRRWRTVTSESDRRARCAEYSTFVEGVYARNRADSEAGRRAARDGVPLSDAESYNISLLLGQRVGDHLDVAELSTISSNCREGFFVRRRVLMRYLPDGVTAVRINSRRALDAYPSEASTAAESEDFGSGDSAAE